MNTVITLALAFALALQGGLEFIKPQSARDAEAEIYKGAPASASEMKSFVHECTFGALSLRRPCGEESLCIYPAGFALTAEIGSWLEFVVERNGERLSYKDFTCELTCGADCAAIYYSGEILALGEGEVSIKVWLDDNPSVYGVSSAVTVVEPELPNSYTSVKGCKTPANPQDEAFEQSIEGFPDSYKSPLRAWHMFHPDWVFKPLDTGLDFWSAVGIQSGGDRNLTLLANMADILKSRAAGDYDRESGSYILKDTGWVETNSIPVSYFMDPRNFLEGSGIFQFETLKYDEAFHTESGVQGIVAGTFMENATADYLDSDKKLHKSDTSYSKAIMNAARETGVNPYYLAAKIRGEIGASKSRSVTGDVAGLEGLYNYYNIGATDGSGNIERALEYAGAQGSYGRPWNTPEKAIVGGARFIAADYVSLGQDTGYLQKFNVAPYTATTKHLHQYMTNVSGAAAQASSAFNGYAKIEMLDMPIEFSIPVFENMPFESRSADELADSTGQSQLAISRANVGIRSAPHLASSSVGELPLGGVVKVSTAVKTDAAHWHSWLIAPFWYCIEYVSPGGRSVEGFVSAEWLELGAFRVLSEGGRATMNVLAQPVGSDDDIRYLSRDDAVATVDKEGVITALGEGRTSIVAYTSGGAFYERSVIVTPNPAQRDDIADE